MLGRYGHESSVETGRLAYDHYSHSSFVIIDVKMKSRMVPSQKQIDVKQAEVFGLR